VLLNADCDDATPEAGARVHRREEAVIGSKRRQAQRRDAYVAAKVGRGNDIGRKFIRLADDADLFTCPKI